MDAIALLNRGLAGRYAVEREIGAGGMATVYLARDLRHDRQVAVKVLEPELGAVVGAERFLSEIRVTARLQHPNLLPLFDSGETEGLLFYVMPFVEGETLRHRLDREKQLPVEDAVHIAVAICRAVDYAHRHGIIHRDLKPENVLLHDGQPMVADFGIALAVSKAAGARLTGTGISLGTPHYMSPEQATGDRSLDARADVYAIAAMTYEMLAGEPPHSGPTAHAIVAKLLSEEPRPLSAVRRLVPAHVEAAVGRGLAKLPADRFATAQQFADALSAQPPAALLAGRPARSSARPWQAAALVFGVMAAGAAAWAVARPDGPTTQHLRFSLALPDSAPIDVMTFNRSFDLSPDGSRLAYVSDNGVFVRDLNDLTPRRLTTEVGRDPQFSADGDSVAYVVNSTTLRIVSVDGGPSRTIVDSIVRYGLSRNGTVVFTRVGGPQAGLWRISQRGGAARRLLEEPTSNATAYGTPVFLPDGDAFVIPRLASGMKANEIVGLRLSDPTPRPLVAEGDHPLYLRDGILVYVRDDDVYAVPFDQRALRVRDDATPMRVFRGVLQKASSAELAVSASGMMVYMPSFAARRIVEYDRLGHQTELPIAPGFFATPRYSPLGDRFVVGKAQGAGAASDIVVYDFASYTPRRLTTNAPGGSPEWTRDGKRIAWTQLQGAIGRRASEVVDAGIYWRAVDESDSATVLVRGGLGLSFSPVADVAVGGVFGSDRRLMLSRTDLATPQKSSPLVELRTPAGARISPDGRWVAHMAPGSILLRRLSGAGGVYPIVVGNATEPMWNPRGNELFYRMGNRLVSAKLKLDPEPRVESTTTVLFDMPRTPGFTWSNYDVSRDGQRFLTVKPIAGSDQPVVITGWADEVRAMMAAK